ncbi:MAG: hypothetical protein AUH39_01575 [Chloroflexi bacterium 13_1_40CM_67_9]|nr:MAG: hypothetical protein AUH39_01575 [Chloroflexi bacterium 13_1_40CM_67_9]
MWWDRSLYETVSFILPTVDRPLHAVGVRAARAGATPRSARMNAWMKKNQRLRRHVLARLRREGPLPITAFEERAAFNWQSSNWDDDRNVALMLHFLMRLGQVSIGGRAGGRRVWTLTESWLPPVRALGTRAAALEATERALRASGIATLKDLRYFYALGSVVTKDALAALERDGVAARVEIEGRREQHFVLVADNAGRVKGFDRTTLLSPFDNLIINRTRTELLFGMRYRMEIYVPKHQRVRGFWAMPILHDGELIGTVDPRMDREHGRLDVLNLHLERDAPRDRRTRRAIADAVQDLAAFAGATDVTWPKGIASSYSRR